MFKLGFSGIFITVILSGAVREFRATPFAQDDHFKNPPPNPI